MKVGYSIGKTVNLGNYESLRIDVKAEIDTDTDKTSYDEIKAWVEEEVKNRVTMAKAEGR